MVQCEICDAAEMKYKCPACMLKYCTVKCFKTHKESGCKVTPAVEIGQIPDQDNQIVENAVPSTEFQFDEECLSEDQVPADKLALLRADEQLLDGLRNPHLRALLSGLDSEMQQGRAAQAIHAAMMEPIFLEFVERCLLVVEPKEE